MTSSGIIYTDTATPVHRVRIPFVIFQDIVDDANIHYAVGRNSCLLYTSGPMASNALKQMVEQGYWEELDYMLIDLPPGTSDIHLTLVQTVALTGAIVVTTPQQVALADAVKGINMF